MSSLFCSEWRTSAQNVPSPAQASAPPATMTTTTTTQVSEAAPATPAPKYVDRPPAIATEGRIIGELHRHGIYW